MATTKPMREVLDNCAHNERFDWSFSPVRRKPSKALRACLDAGLVREAGYCIVVDGDGFTVEPERERMGYRLTDAGKAAIKAADAEYSAARRA